MLVQPMILLALVGSKWFYLNLITEVEHVQIYRRWKGQGIDYACTETGMVWYSCIFSVFSVYCSIFSVFLYDVISLKMKYAESDTGIVKVAFLLFVPGHMAMHGGGGGTGDGVG